MRYVLFMRCSWLPSMHIAQHCAVCIWLNALYFNPFLARVFALPFYSLLYKRLVHARAHTVKARSAYSSFYSLAMQKARDKKAISSLHIYSYAAWVYSINIIVSVFKYECYFTVVQALATLVDTGASGYRTFQRQSIFAPNRISHIVSEMLHF